MKFALFSHHFRIYCTFFHILGPGAQAHGAQAQRPRPRARRTGPRGHTDSAHQVFEHSARYLRDTVKAAKNSIETSQKVYQRTFDQEIPVSDTITVTTKHPGMTQKLSHKLCQHTFGKLWRPVSSARGARAPARCAASARSASGSTYARVAACRHGWGSAGGGLHRGLALAGEQNRVPVGNTRRTTGRAVLTV